jgi:hypothetical protein
MRWSMETMTLALAGRVRWVDEAGSSRLDIMRGQAQFRYHPIPMIVYEQTIPVEA